MIGELVMMVGEEGAGKNHKCPFWWRLTSRLDVLSEPATVVSSASVIVALRLSSSWQLGFLLDLARQGKDLVMSQTSDQGDH
jgi:hypothetical protein